MPLQVVEWLIEIAKTVVQIEFYFSYPFPSFPLYLFDLINYMIMFFVHPVAVLIKGNSTANYRCIFAKNFIRVSVFGLCTIFLHFVKYVFNIRYQELVFDYIITIEI